MPSPAAHYAEAERLLVKAADCVVASITRQLVDLAQVHPALATCYPPGHVDYDAEPASLMRTIEPTGDRL